MLIIPAVFVLAAIWYYSFQHMQAAKRRAALYREPSWRSNLMMIRVLLEIPEITAESVYTPEPVLVPSYAQERPAREAAICTVDSFIDEALSTSPIEAIGNAHGLFKSSHETFENFKQRVIERLDIQIGYDKERTAQQ